MLSTKNCGNNFLQFFRKEKSVYQPYLFHNSQASTNAIQHCPQGPRSAQQSFILEGPTQRSNPLPFNIPFLAQKVFLFVYPLLTNFISSFSYLVYNLSSLLTAVNAMSLKLEKSQNQNVSSTFSQRKMRLLALLQNQMTDFSTLPLQPIIGSTPPPQSNHCRAGQT